MFRHPLEQQWGASAWNSRATVPLPYELASQSWASDDYDERPRQQSRQQPSQQSSTRQQNVFSPPGLARLPFHPDSLIPGSAHSIHAPRNSYSGTTFSAPAQRPQPEPYTNSTPASDVNATVPPRRSSGKDEFDGPHQFLPRPEDAHLEIAESQLVPLTISLHPDEQSSILTQVNDCLSKCAFDFIAKYQFPIPLEADKRPVRVPGDREWTEWSHLLKRLATKRRIPMRVLWNGQIKQLVTVLENSLEMRHTTKQQNRSMKDDRNILQLISAGLQVTKMLKDPRAMMFLDDLYRQTEHIIRMRAGHD